MLRYDVLNGLGRETAVNAYFSTRQLRLFAVLYQSNGIVHGLSLLNGSVEACATYDTMTPIIVHIMLGGNIRGFSSINPLIARHANSCF